MTAEQRPPSAGFSDVDAGSEPERARAVAALDVQATFPAILRLRAWALQQLDPQPGMRAVDVGCGTGEDTRALAAAVGPSGEAVGVDPSRVMLEEAERRNGAARSSARFVEGRADRLPFGDGEVDLVRCERVLQHLDDPVPAVAEMTRVLRPGGRLVLLDTDWRTLSISPGDPATAAAVREAWTAVFPNPGSGGQLLDLVQRAGLEPASVTAEVLLLRPRDADLPPLSLMVAAVSAMGSVPAEQLDGWVEQLREAAARGSLLGTVTVLGVTATRPWEDRRQGPAAAPG